MIKEYLKQSPNAGQVLVQGHIAGLGLRVQHDRVRKARHSINGSHPKQAAIFQRVYSVPGPNSLWHVDGNHKMIRWRLVIHGGIDGYSRLITYLQCSNNNRSDTVLAAFVGACEVFGVPPRVRSDKGGENIDIWRYMTATRGEHRGSYIAGPSVHNTRIERLWRDVYTAVTTVYVKIFLELEESGALDPNTDADIFCFTCNQFLDFGLLTLQGCKQGGCTICSLPTLVTLLPNCKCLTRGGQFSWCLLSLN